jgi:hypothetical protein
MARQTLEDTTDKKLIGINLAYKNLCYNALII